VSSIPPCSIHFQLLFNLIGEGEQLFYQFALRDIVAFCAPF
jgi:hypothetical protein